MSVTVTSPTTCVMPRGNVQFSWTTVYPQAAYEILYKEAGATAWQTFGRATSTAQSVNVDVSRLIDFKEYHFRIVVYSVNNALGESIYNGSDMSPAYSIVVTPKYKLAEMKARYRNKMVQVPIYTDNNGDSIRIAMGNDMIGVAPLTTLDNGIASELHVAHPKGDRAFVRETPAYYTKSGASKETYIRRDDRSTEYRYYVGYGYSSYLVSYYISSYSYKYATQFLGYYLQGYGTVYGTYYRGYYASGTYYYYSSGVDYDYYQYRTTGSYTYYAGTYGGGYYKYYYYTTGTYYYFEGSGSKYYCYNASYKSGSTYKYYKVCNENMCAGPFTYYMLGSGNSWVGGVMYYRTGYYYYWDYGSYRYYYSSRLSGTTYAPYYGYYRYYSAYYAQYYGYYRYNTPNYNPYYSYYRYSGYIKETYYKYSSTYWYNDAGMYYGYLPPAYYAYYEAPAYYYQEPEPSYYTPDPSYTYYNNPDLNYYFAPDIYAPAYIPPFYNTYTYKPTTYVYSMPSYDTV